MLLKVKLIVIRFQAWAQTVMGRCRSWTDEQLETAGVLALIYGKVNCLVTWHLGRDISLTLTLFSSSKFGVRRRTR